MLYLGGVTLIAGLFGLGGSFGEDGWTRTLGAAVALVGLVMVLLALTHLRR
jgi:hypothetical protein